MYNFLVQTTFSLFYSIEIGGTAAVGTVSGGFDQISGFFQIGYSPLDRGAGQLHVRGDGLDAGPALALSV